MFAADGGFFTATFKRPKKNDTVNTGDGTINGIIKSKEPIEEVVFQLISINEGISARKISEQIGKSLRSTMRYLDTLKETNRIEFRGALKNGGYYLKD